MMVIDNFYWMAFLVVAIIILISFISRSEGATQSKKGSIKVYTKYGMVYMNKSDFINHLAKLRKILNQKHGTLDDATLAKINNNWTRFMELNDISVSPVRAEMFRPIEDSHTQNQSHYPPNFTFDDDFKRVNKVIVGDLILSLTTLLEAAQTSDLSKGEFSLYGMDNVFTLIDKTEKLSILEAKNGDNFDMPYGYSPEDNLEKENEIARANRGCMEMSHYAQDKMLDSDGVLYRQRDIDPRYNPAGFRDDCSGDLGHFDDFSESFTYSRQSDGSKRTSFQSQPRQRSEASKSSL
jgi:hypothetical protein